MDQTSMSRLFFVLLSEFLCLTLGDRRREYTLTVSYAENCSSIVLINARYPGPLLEADLNEILVVHVKNDLTTDEELTIHFHGMLMHQTPEMDGVPYVTQMPIPRGKQFTYVIRAHPAGTYFYHSHSGLQAVTAFGPLLVHDRRRSWPWREFPSGPLLFSDRWQQVDRRRQEEALLGSPFGWEGEPTALLINGKRNFTVTLEAETKYLLRLIGATSLSTVVFGIAEHPMTVVEVDGTRVKQKSNLTSIEIASGQRYAVIIETKKQTHRAFQMELAVRWRRAAMNSRCSGLLQYPGGSSVLSRPSLSNELDLLHFAQTEPYQTIQKSDEMPRGTADREYLLLNSEEHTSDRFVVRWLINNGTLDMARLMHLTRPLLLDLFDGKRDNLPSDVTYRVENNQLVDLILQNTVALNGVCETHPFHLHGHKFWLHSQGSGLYQTSTPIAHPVLRDTSILYASHFSANHSTFVHRQPCGWTKIRFRANNPGLWMFHCHIGAHAIMGMSILIEQF